MSCACGVEGGGGFGSMPFGSGPFGSSEAPVTLLYAMRARNLADAAYVSWMVSGTPDTTGAEAPITISPGSATVSAFWGLPELLIERVDVTDFQVTDEATGANNPGISTNIVLVDTADVDWNANDVITLPGTPQTQCKITVKDATGSAASKPIVIDGNGHTIDGAATRSIATSYGALSMVYTGSNWVVV